uniref:Putative polyprotein n=1 Tax=Albugo laibachii Nc14 TaxID=890382 RepID=F0WA28_9STRA|nr:putative polyprotein [Albugo laibachii Nc14]|eukprot:CCA17998.1 putative polyprotein [Albugo laibachii Nc14]
MQNRESSQVALQATRGRISKKKYQRHPGTAGEEFNGKCFQCEKRRHRKNECRTRLQQVHRSSKPGDTSHAFMAVDHMERNIWLLDSGATSHMCYQKSDFQSLRNLEAPIKISIADGSSVEAVATGNISITLTNGERVTIHDVLYVPDLDRRLLSIPADEANHPSATSKNMYMLELLVGTSKSIASVASLRVSKQDLNLWHAWVGHLPIDQIQKLQQCVSGIHVNELLAHDVYDDEDVCSGCAKGKASVKPFNKLKNKEYSTTDVLEIVHSDIMGPITPTSVGGSRYVLTFTDDYSRLVTVYFLKTKSQVVDYSIEYKSKMERQTTKQLKCIRTDNGTEYVKKRFAAECRRSGIVHQTTAPFAPQQNGLAEHKNVEKEWWAEAVNSAAYITNRVPNHRRSNTTPFETCFGFKPDLGHLRVFGSTGFAHIDKSKRSKLDAKAYPCLFLGYTDDLKSYRVFNKLTNRVEISRSVQLWEGSETRYVRVNDHSPTVLRRPVFNDDAEGEDPLHRTLPESQHMEIDQLSPTPEGSSPMDVDEDLCHEIVPLAPHPVITYGQGSETSLAPRGSVGPDERLEDFSTSIVPRRLAVVDDDDGRNPNRLRLMSEHANAAIESPATYEEAVKSGDGVQWKSAIASEFQCLDEKKTWIIVDRPSGQKLIGCKWVFAIKRDEHGKVQRYKARLVAQGFRQKAGVDYSDPYAPVASTSPIRIFLGISVQLDYDIYQYDVDAAFLNGKLGEEVYMWPPPGLAAEPGQVCKLQRSLYGLNQDLAVWYKTNTNVFLKIKFQQCKSDACIFVRRDQTYFAYIALYVNDMLISARSFDVIENISHKLAKIFKLKKLGMAKFILGMELSYNINNKLMYL